jgi:hypothetical protein
VTDCAIEQVTVALMATLAFPVTIAAPEMRAALVPATFVVDVGSA